MSIVKITQIKPNPKNPRTIKDERFEKLKKSIEDFPDMLNKRPLVCFTDTDGKYVVLGGNMRLKAAKDLGLKQLPIILADEWTEEQKAEFLIKDNVGYGEWDWQQLATDWDNKKLEEWGLEIEKWDNDDIKKEENPYTEKINIPIYEANNEKPKLLETYNKDKFEQLINKIELSSLDKEYKEFLKLCATRHIVFNYQKIADLYSHSDEQMQDLMEQSALVIIDYNKAIENGFIKLTEELKQINIDLEDDYEQ
jgi:ParB-like chromosome segregation protein Spo0J